MAQTAALVLQGAGTALSAKGQIDQGRASKRAAFAEANLMEQAGNQRLKEAKMAVFEDERQGKKYEGDLIANAAASGGGVTDPTVMNILKELAGETHYKKMIDIYQGQSAQATSYNEAALVRQRGRDAMKASQIGAATTVLNSAGQMGMAAKYGGMGGGT